MSKYTKVDNIYVDNRIFTAKFCCDYSKCKGACCNQSVQGVSLLGGALSDYDAAQILYHRKHIASLCEKDDQPVVNDSPVSEYKETFYTTLHREKCVLCNMEKGCCVLKIAKEKIPALNIPLSCQLYPILWEVYDNHEYLNICDVFDKYCAYGYKKGEQENVFLIDFLKVPIIRGLGDDFYQKLKEAQKKFL